MIFQIIRKREKVRLVNKVFFLEVYSRLMNLESSKEILSIPFQPFKKLEIGSLIYFLREKKILRK